MSGKKIIDGIAFSIEGLKRDADEIEACGAGNEAAQMRWAAAALSEAQATIARQQVMLDRALESNGDMQAEVARLREALRPFAQTHAWGPDDRFEIVLAGPYGSITGADLDRACAALEAKHG